MAGQKFVVEGEIVDYVEEKKEWRDRVSGAVQSFVRKTAILKSLGGYSLLSLRETAAPLTVGTKVKFPVNSMKEVQGFTVLFV